MGIAVYVVLVLAVMLINDIRRLVCTLTSADRIERNKNLRFLAAKYMLLALFIAYVLFTRPTFWDLIGTGFAFVCGGLLIPLVIARRNAPVGARGSGEATNDDAV